MYAKTSGQVPAVNARERTSAYLGLRRRPPAPMTRSEITRNGVRAGVAFGIGMFVLQLVMSGWSLVLPPIAALVGAGFGWMMVQTMRGQQFQHFGGPRPEDRNA